MIITRQWSHTAQLPKCSGCPGWLGTDHQSGAPHPGRIGILSPWDWPMGTATQSWNIWRCYFPAFPTGGNCNTEGFAVGMVKDPSVSVWALYYWRCPVCLVPCRSSLSPWVLAGYHLLLCLLRPENPMFNAVPSSADNSLMSIYLLFL